MLIILPCESYHPLWVLVTSPDDQLASLQRDPVAFPLLSAQEEMRVVAGQIVAASPQQCTCSQCPEHLAVLGWEHCCAGTTYLFTWLCFVWLFSFPQAQGGSSRGPDYFEDLEAIKRAVMMELRGIPEESFLQCIDMWQRMEKCIRLTGITLKVKPCKLLFGLEINCLWHQSRYFSDHLVFQIFFMMAK